MEVNGGEGRDAFCKESDLRKNGRKSSRPVGDVRVYSSKLHHPITWAGIADQTGKIAVLKSPKSSASRSGPVDTTILCGTLYLSMAAATDLPALVESLTSSLTTASTSLPDSTALAPPPDGISLFDTKNELLLSYLQNLVFLILLKIRNNSAEQDVETPALQENVTRKLVELRIYLEKGVRPLESKLKYQLDKLLLLASEADATPTIIGHEHTNTLHKAPISKTRPDSADGSHSESDPSPAQQVSDLSHRPNPAAFINPSSSDRPRYSNKETSDSVYRPPRITPTSLPTTTPKAAKETKPRKSHLLNSFVSEEMDDAPLAEPSIGAGSGLKGREKEREEEKRRYEEMRLVRLSGEKRGKKRRVQSGDGRGDLDMAGLGMGEEFGELKAPKKRRGGERGEGRVGEAWEKRVKMGTGRKKR